MRLSELIINSLPLESTFEVYGLPEMAAGDAKEIPQEDWDKAMQLVKDHNNSGAIDSAIKGFYYIDVTGRWQVYFTLWRWKDIDPKIAQFIHNPIYMGNMTTHFLTSVEKALSKVPKTVRFQIVTEENREGLIGKNAARNNEDIKFTFGKYRGQSLGEVYLENPSYFAWLAKNADPQYANNKINIAISVFANMYFEEVTRQNKEKFKDVDYAGKIGDRWEGEIEVYKFEKRAGQAFGYLPRGAEPPTYTTARAVDKNGNKFIVNNLDKAFPGQVIDKGTKLSIRGKVVDQKEILGVKFTKIGYVKPLNPSGVLPQVQDPKQPELPIQTSTGI